MRRALAAVAPIGRAATAIVPDAGIVAARDERVAGRLTGDSNPVSHVRVELIDTARTNIRMETLP